MRGLYSLTIAPAFTLLVTVTVLAQVPAVKPAPRPAQPQPAQPAVTQVDPVRFGQISPMFQNEATRRELQINTEQFNRLNDANERVRNQFRDDLANVQRANEQERARMIEELNRRFITEMERRNADILNQNQVTRLRQLELQRQGLTVFANPDVRRSLNLNDQQVRQLQDLNQQRNRDLNDLLRNRNGTRDEQIQRLRDFNAQSREELNKVLTPEQQKSFQGMTGESFFFPPNFGTTTTNDQGQNPR